MGSWHTGVELGREQGQMLGGDLGVGEVAQDCRVGVEARTGPTQALEIPAGPLPWDVGVQWWEWRGAVAVQQGGQLLGQRGPLSLVQEEGRQQGRPALGWATAVCGLRLWRVKGHGDP